MGEFDLSRHVSQRFSPFNLVSSGDERSAGSPHVNEEI